MLANHTFHTGGKRTSCGYGARKHVNTTAQQIKRVVWDWKGVLDGATHYRVLDIDEQIVCQDCSQIVSETLVHSPAYEVEDHKSVDGACSVGGAPYCEYKNAF